MKNNAVTGILALAVVVLYILHFTGGSSTSEIVDENIEAVDSLKADSLPKFISTGDTSFMDSLKSAEYSKIGYLNLFAVIQECPTLAKDQQQIAESQKSILRRQEAIQKDMESYAIQKNKELEEKQKSGLLTQAGYQNAVQEMAIKEQEARQSIERLEREYKNIARKEQLVSEKRDALISKALKVLNEKVDLDYILIENGNLKTVYALNAKNDITEAMIKLINSKDFQ